MNVEHVPEIPGYRVLHPLGRGGMASVYLAMQESVEREVALKIMAPQLSADPTFGERFLREARIAAKLHHRHVVSIFDVGVHNGFHYCTMEYMPGGPVMRRGSPPLALKPALRCVREIALALHYAQGKGFIHRDVKPDNILLREDGSCVLGDFGIARAADSGTQMTKAGSVVGTPHYMSPEQLRGREIDGRADLYSLGVVFFQLVTGKVPFEASDSLAIGIMHMTAPLPQLPAEYRMLQPVLDRMMAKEPADRFQTGAEIDAALGEIEKRIASGRTDPTPPSSTGEAPTRALPPMRAERKSGYDTQGILRTEPQLGQIDAVDDDSIRATPRPQTRAAPAPRPSTVRAEPRRGIWWVLISIVLLGGIALWQRPLITRWVQAQLNAPQSELDLADQALASGQLFGANGADALSLYVAALMLDGENPRAIRGLKDTLARLYEDVARQPRDEVQIAAIIRRLTGLRGFDAELAGFQGLLSATGETQQTELAGDKATADLQAAQRAESEGRLDGPSGALARFTAAQSLDASNAEARRGVDRVAAALATQARRHLKDGDLAAAERLQRELAVIPTVIDIAAALDKDIKAQRSAESGRTQIPDLLADAERLAAQGQLVERAGASAADRFTAVLTLDSNNAAAKAGLTRVATGALTQIEAAIEAKEFDRAARLLKRVQALAPRTRGVGDAKERLEDAIARSKAPDPAKLAVHDRMIAEGQQALANKQLLEPPGDSAYDKFRGALAIDPRSASARAGMDAIAQALRERIEESIAAGRATRADADLAALDTVAPRFAGFTELKRRVAQAYAKNGLRSLASGALDQARSDLVEAERLDATESSVVQLRGELQGR